MRSNEARDGEEVVVIYTVLLRVSVSPLLLRPFPGRFFCLVPGSFFSFLRKAGDCSVIKVPWLTVRKGSQWLS